MKKRVALSFAIALFSANASAITFSNWVLVDLIDDSYGIGATLSPVAGNSWFNTTGVEGCTDSSRVRIDVADGDAKFNRRLAMVLTAGASDQQVRVRVNGCLGVHPKADLVQTRNAP